MRLTTEQVQASRHAAQRVLGADARVSVFGSMALDDREGGDIELLFEASDLTAQERKALKEMLKRELEARQ